MRGGLKKGPVISTCGFGRQVARFAAGKEGEAERKQRGSGTRRKKERKSEVLTGWGRGVSLRASVNVLRPRDWL